ERVFLHRMHLNGLLMLFFMTLGLHTTETLTPGTPARFTLRELPLLRGSSFQRLFGCKIVL
ncbi:MAG TPA: hypothetical protein DCE41_10325, partial [Cytophagales bacterium]|nr:hypothetical protein [Cytophagales bacterium]